VIRQAGCVRTSSRRGKSSRETHLYRNTPNPIYAFLPSRRDPFFVWASQGMLVERGIRERGPYPQEMFLLWASYGERKWVRDRQTDRQRERHCKRETEDTGINTRGCLHWGQTTVNPSLPPHSKTVPWAYEKSCLRWICMPLNQPSIGELIQSEKGLYILLTVSLP